MKNMIRVLYVILFLLIILVKDSAGQNNLSDVKIQVSDRTIYLDSDSTSDYGNFYKYKVSVSQFITMRNKRDTLILKLECPSPFNSVYLNVFFHELKITSRIKNNIVDVPFKFDGETLFIYKNSDNICITYEYQPDFIFKNQGDASIYILPSMQDWHSWYFTSPDMITRSFTASTTGSAYLLTNIKHGTIDKNLSINLKNKDQTPISFFVLSKPLYARQSYNLEDKQLDVYQMTSYRVDTIFSRAENHSKIQFRSMPSYSLQKFKTDILNEYIHTLTGFFVTKRNISSITVIEAPLGIKINNDDDAVKWGRTYKSRKSSYMTIIDSSFWYNNRLMHELLHMYTSESHIKQDSAQYLFDESLIEFLSVFLKYNDPIVRDSVFQSKHINYIKSNTSYTSIFRLTNNSISEGDTCSASDIIYLEVPYRLYCFGKSIGEDRFIQVIKETYSRKNIDLVVFEKLLKKVGVLKSDWIALVQSI